MRKIINPYPKLLGYRCFGCSPDNEHGLQMEFVEDGDSVICNWSPKKHLEGYHNVLHGGIQATLIDEAGSWYVQVKEKTAGVTSNLNVRYLKPVLLSKGDIIIKASLLKKRRNLIDIVVEIIDSENTVCAEATVTYFTFPAEVAKKNFNYPEYNEFFEIS